MEEYNYVTEKLRFYRKIQLCYRSIKISCYRIIQLFTEELGYYFIEEYYFSD